MMFQILSLITYLCVVLDGDVDVVRLQDDLIRAPHYVFRHQPGQARIRSLLISNAATIDNPGAKIVTWKGKYLVTIFCGAGAILIPYD